MKETVKKYKGVFWLGIMILLLVVNWYVVAYSNADTLKVEYMNVAGWKALSNGFCIGYILYLVCLVTQYIAAREKKYYIITIIMQLVFMVEMKLLVFQIGGGSLLDKNGLRAAYVYMKEGMLQYKVGFYLAEAVLLVSVVMNVIDCIKARKEKA